MSASGPDGYREEVRRIYVRDGAELSDSRTHPGYRSDLARDRNTNDLSHTVIGDLVDTDESSAESADSIHVGRDDEDDLEIPGALLAFGAGIAVGAAGFQYMQHRRKKRESKAAETETEAPTEAPPAGWYTDPSDRTQRRYWDGSAWTHHVASAAASPGTPADWYPDPSDASQLRYWDGSAWTHHVAPRPGTAPAVRADDVPRPRELPAGSSEPTVSMSSAEWQAHGRAWAAAAAMEQELWWRLTHAQIVDADPTLRAAQHELARLTPEQGAHRIRLTLEANPHLRDGLDLAQLLRIAGDVRTAEDPAKIGRVDASHDEIGGHA
ncbi:DUF2510 domain-containing protein [Isoptericola sp. b408]|uniref:DUF2510 domain-containing protein n=1 Tax=Isoptericola sp. b408 TaxID=3064653 RepID=UPI002712FAC1|nr:DUF2510 domain-containing protein [Isoptericola sp. b408]MDO8150190.1 DUF2510 domain-containing protein [Isoptericola sp. b408]